MTTNITHIGEEEDSKPINRERRPTNRTAGRVAVVATGVLAALGAAMATVTNVMGKDGDATKQNMVPPNNPIVPAQPAAVDSRTQGVAAVGTVTEGVEGQRVERFRYTSLGGNRVLDISIWQEGESVKARVVVENENFEFTIPKTLEEKFGGTAENRAKIATIIYSRPSAYRRVPEALERELRGMGYCLRDGDDTLIRNETDSISSSNR